jgi:ubiquinone/menaquinone biosynthesis C-methylase UbiE
VVTQDIDTTYISDYKIDSIKKIYGKFDTKYLKMKIPFVMGDFHSTNLSKNTFDVVLMTSVHHELVYKDETINDIFKALKPNGKLYLSELTAKRKIKRPECSNYFSIEEELINDFVSRNFILENKIVNHTYKKGKKNQVENCVFIFKKKS